LENLIPAVPSHFQEWAGYFGQGDSRAQILRFCTIFVNSEQIYHIKLLNKPGTNIDEIEKPGTNIDEISQLLLIISIYSILISNVLETGPFVW